MEPEERLFRFKEAAKRLAVSDSHLKRLYREGKVRVVHLGQRAVRISQRELQRLCKEE